MTQNHHSRLLSPEDAERWRERVRHGTVPNGVLVMVDEIERLYEQLAATKREADDLYGKWIAAVAEGKARIDSIEEQLEASERRADAAVAERQKWRAETHRIEEQLEAAQRENTQLGDELGSVALHVETMRGEIRRALASIALEFYAGSRGRTAEILRSAHSSPASEPEAS